MKKVEVKRLGPVSLFKTMLYMMSIPMALFIVIGLITAIIGAANGGPKMFGLGIYMGLINPLIMIVFYGLFTMLMAVIYNALAGKFGGLELTLEELDDSEIQPVSSEDAQ